MDKLLTRTAEAIEAVEQLLLVTYPAEMTTRDVTEHEDAVTRVEHELREIEVQLGGVARRAEAGDLSEDPKHVARQIALLAGALDLEPFTLRDLLRRFAEQELGGVEAVERILGES